MQYRPLSTRPAARSARATNWRVAAGLAAATVVTACGGGGGGSAQTAGVAASAVTDGGTLKLALTDAPGCGFEQVNVTIEKVRVHASSLATDADAGWVEMPLSPARRVDLLTLTNGALQELGATPLPPGHYEQLRLVFAANVPASGVLANSVVPTGASGEAPLGMPPAREIGVKVAASFDVAANHAADLVLDFDACKSVGTAGQDQAYRLRPVIAAMPRVASGIEGKLDNALGAAGTTVSAQRDGEEVRSTRADAKGNFSIPFLAAGTYTLVVSSDGRATGVVTGVPVGGAITTVSTSTSPIALPASTMGEITGVTTLGIATDNSPEVTSALTEAQVRASQTLASGETIEVRSRPVDALLGNYRLRVPKAAPVQAVYAASGSLAFAPDAAGAPPYSIDVLMQEDTLPAQ